MASTSPTRASASPTPPPLQRTSTAGTHQCWICLQSDTETPDEPFVNPCPCTLEAHQSCLLTWISESERSWATKGKTPQCPGCKAPIIVEEPYDPVLALRAGLNRGLAKVSPYVLLALVMSGSAVGSGWYGLLSAHIFAGPEAASKWLGLGSLIGRTGRDGPLWRWAPFWTFTVKTWMLSCVGPGLLVWRAVPGVGNLLLVPVSLMSAGMLVARDDMPRWPPSPAWVATLFPLVTLTYNNLYYEYFGAFEKRLNMTIRGRPAVEDPGNPEQAGDAAVQREGGHQVIDQAQDHDHRDHSIWHHLWNLGHAVVDVFRDHHTGEELDAGLREAAIRPEGIEIEIEMDAGDAAGLIDMLGDAVEVLDGDEDDEEEMRGLQEDVEVEEQDVAGPVMPPASTAAEPNQPEQGIPPAQPQVAVADEPAPAPAPAPNNPAAAAQAAPVAPRETNLLRGIVSGVVLSLLHPTICFGMGEVLRLTLPRSWIAPRSWGRTPTGLLQQQWGRSLVGGCVYVVLRDAFKLYAKYRQVQVKTNRRVKNVPRRTVDTSS